VHVVSTAVEVGAGVESENFYHSEWSPHIRPDDQLSFVSGVESLINLCGAGVSPEPAQGLISSLKLEARSCARRDASDALEHRRCRFRH